MTVGPLRSLGVVETLGFVAGEVTEGEMHRLFMLLDCLLHDIAYIISTGIEVNRNAKTYTLTPPANTKLAVTNPALRQNANITTNEPGFLMSSPLNRCSFISLCL